MLIESASIKSRAYLSVNAIVAAASLAKQAREIEDGYDGNDDKYFQANAILHRGLSISSIVMSATFLEAFINELYSDSNEEGEHGALKDLSASERRLLATLWGHDIPRTSHYSILKKYQIALDVLGKPKLESSVEPFQSAKVLTTVRNSLIHFEPEWQEHPIEPQPQKGQHKFEKDLKRYKITPNKLSSDVMPFYPDKLLGFGCCKWAVTSAIAFTDAFCQNMGIKPFYNINRSQLTLS